MTSNGDRLQALQAENVALRRRVAELERQLEQRGAPDSDRHGTFDSYAQLFDDLPIPIVVFQPDGLAVAINRRNEALVGSSREAIVGRHNIFADPEANEQGYVACFKEALRGQDVKMPPTAYDTGKALLQGRVDDRLIWSETTYFPVRDERGQIVYIGELNLDVTERMRAKAEQHRLSAVLQRRNQRLRGVFEYATLGIAVVGPDRKILDANPAIHRILGYEPGSLVGRTFVEITHPDDVAADVELFGELLNELRETYYIEKRYLRADGQIVHCRLHVSALRGSDGTVECALGLVEDVTARRQTEQALHAQQRMLSRFIEHVPAAVFAKDRVGRYILANSRFSSFNHLQPDDLVGRSDEEICSPEQAARYIASDREVIERRATVEWEHEDEFDGERRTFLTTKFPLIDENGSCYAVCGIATDITARKREEADRLEFERKMLETQKLESLGLLAGGIAHDFNNLLVAMLGNASLLVEDLAPGTPERASVDQIVIAARRAADLTRQMLVYAGKARVDTQSLDLNQLVQEMIHLLQTSVAKHVTLRTELAASLPTIEGDPTQLRQVVMNLVMNAAESIDERSGAVTVRTGTMRPDPAYLVGMTLAPAFADRDYVYLEVSDTGCGIDPTARAKIFEPFFSTKFTGRGLGLAAVLGIVRSHRGGVGVESRAGQGSTFRVLLPGVEAPPAVREPDAARDDDAHLGGPPVGGRAATVLVIDDEPDVRAVAAATLERLGVGVLTAADGAAGLALLRRNLDVVTLVLLDLTMPKLSGAETLHLLRQLRPKLPVVLMSGYSQQAMIEQLAGDDSARFLAKPFTAAELRAALWAALA